MACCSNNKPVPMMADQCNIQSPHILLIATLLTTGTAVADPVLSLHADNGLIGSEFQAGISINPDALTSTGGFNGSILLPPTMAVTDASWGSAVNPSEWNLQFAQNGNDFRFVTYSTSANTTVNGEFLQFTIHIDASETPGVRQLTFADANPDPRVNSRHAITNVDGSLSLDHTTSSASFLIYNMTSDHDGDGMSDYFESRYGLDPFSNDANLDSDGDGYTNLDEYNRKSDPTDKNDYNDCLGDEIHIVSHTYGDSRPYICRANTTLIMDSGADIVVSETASVYFGAPAVVVESGSILTVRSGGIFRVY
ncbi:MAG TPA: hypothetical protein ENJ12_12085 [Thiolapillus brandeum]|uniref:Uncharacterized protein n=1 Tax=Thiolapillus brandeum TaxID=1076588 RepID=A0A831RYJ2_9GAMM|nr:hypothetical protein [Thiolapillus brandeum]